MRIGIIGSGISGLVAAHRLSGTHDVTVFESNAYVGGHTHTVTVDDGGHERAIDTGFIVFNDRTYPRFCALLDQLQVSSQPTTMSFSVRCDRTGLEYNGTSLNGLFAQRRNLFRPRFLRMVRDILRFNRESPEVLESGSEQWTVGAYIRSRGYSREFTDQYLLPMGAAIWSCPTTTFAEFPIRFIVEFYLNHGLLSIRNRPVWRVIQGGSHNYVKVLTKGFQDRIRLRTPVRSVVRSAREVQVGLADGSGEKFDEVIFACHSDQALRILGGNASPVEREVLGAIPYEPNVAILHTDERLLPHRKRAWASWNYLIPREGEIAARATVTYNMNMLQRFESRQTYCVTLNDEQAVRPERILGRFEYSHPVFTIARAQAQSRHCELIRNQRTSFCGAYWGYGFHEDGVQSAERVCARFEDRIQNPPLAEPVNA